MSRFDLDAWLKVQQVRVEQALKARMAELAMRAPKRLAEAMEYSLLAGGKRLRPVLCFAFADAVSRSTTQKADRPACAVEMVHTYSLIHDDLPAMDDDDLRRGRPTNHKVYGEAMAILAGDALLTDAFVGLDGRLALELATAAGSAGMVGGQVLDIAEDRPAEEGYLLKLHRAKTGALIKAACRMGAIAGGGDEAALHAAETFGDAVGLGFQIADDILDVTASAEVMGKPTGADAAAGRHTFPAVVGLERARALAQEQVQRAVAAISRLEPQDGPLAALARYSVERKN
ncbi:MAG: polyprenyl synthetase family protein [Myxococcaceae bacterium]|nr:polyprenyl synthetase family protein [Myxococcaceae bacterium]